MNKDKNKNQSSLLIFIFNNFMIFAIVFDFYKCIKNPSHIWLGFLAPQVGRRVKKTVQWTVFSQSRERLYVAVWVRQDFGP